MILTVPWKKGGSPSGDFAHAYLVGRRSVRRFHPRFARVFNERIEARASENTDLSGQLRLHTRGW
jgi:hypothetical protein